MPPETNKSHMGLIVGVVAIVLVAFAAFYFWNGQDASAPTGGESNDISSIESELQGLELETIGEDLEMI